MRRGMRCALREHTLQACDSRATADLRREQRLIASRLVHDRVDVSFLDGPVDLAGETARIDALQAARVVTREVA